MHLFVNIFDRFQPQCRTGMILLSVILVTVGPLLAQPKLYLVRHAEKVADWPGGELGPLQPLSEKGLHTAAAFAKYFADEPVVAVYSSKTTRTLHTAFAIAQKNGFTLMTEEACADTAAIDLFLQMVDTLYDDDSAVIIVSHSNIIPYFLIKCGLTRQEYDAMGFTTDGNWLLTDYYGELFEVLPLTDKADPERIKRVNVMTQN